MLVKVNVTKGDIIHGRRHNCTDCAVARAIRRAMGGDALVTVARDKARVNGMEFPLPEHVSSAVVAIDAGWGKLVRPFEFAFEVEEVRAAA